MSSMIVCLFSMIVCLFFSPADPNTNWGVGDLPTGRQAVEKLAGNEYSKNRNACEVLRREIPNENGLLHESVSIRGHFIYWQHWRRNTSNNDKESTPSEMQIFQICRRVIDYFELGSGIIDPVFRRKQYSAPTISMTCNFHSCNPFFCERRFWRRIFIHMSFFPVHIHWSSLSFPLVPQGAQRDEYFTNMGFFSLLLFKLQSLLLSFWMGPIAG